MDLGDIPVAPFAGAWIEIVPLYARYFSTTSLPSRERGLKSRRGYVEWRFKKSLPSRERGLKLIDEAHHSKANSVAPFAGAWIEI